MDDRDTELEQRVNYSTTRVLEYASYFEALNYLRYFAKGMQRYLIRKRIFNIPEIEQIGIMGSLKTPKDFVFFSNGFPEVNARKEGYRIMKFALQNLENPNSQESKKEVELLYQSIFLKLYLKLEGKGKKVFADMPKQYQGMGLVRGRARTLAG